MPAAWVSAAVGVYGAISASDAQDSANQTQQSSIAASQKASQDQLDFDKQKYYDNKPVSDALGQQAVATNAQQQAIAAQQAGRSQQAWNQNQQASAGVAGTVGLNALGGQYLSPAQQQELLGLQQALAKQGGSQPAANAVPGSLGAAQNPQGVAQQLIQQPALNSGEQARLAQLQNMQKSATMVGGNSSTGHWEPSNNDGGGDRWVPDTPTAGTSSFTPAMQQEMDALTKKSQAPAAQTKSTIPTATPGTNGEQAPQAGTDANSTAGLYNGMNADQIQQRINELQQAANKGAQQRELDKAGLITGTASKYGTQLTDLGESNAQSILGDSQGLQNQLIAQGDARRADVTGVARQRAADYEAKAGTQANAAIASSADQANRQMLRLGGDPNRMAAMGLDTANNQQLARISAGNQIAGINIANQNNADDQGRAFQYGAQDQAFGIKSAALDAARASRTGAKQAALGLNLGAQQQSDTLTGNARDVADAKLNSLAQGSLNMTQGFANTSGQQALGATQAGTAGVNNLNTGSNAGLNAAGLVNQGTSNVIASSRIGAGYTPVNYSGQIGSNIGTAASGLQDLYKKYTGGSNGLSSAGVDGAGGMGLQEGAYPTGLGG